MNLFELLRSSKTQTQATKPKPGMLPDTRKLNHANCKDTPISYVLPCLGTLEQLLVKKQMPTDYTLPFPSMALPCPHAASCLLLESA